MNEGDEIDLTRSKEDDKVALFRFKVLTIDKDLTKKSQASLEWNSIWQSDNTKRGF